jgi:hypothetical protein
MWCHILLVPRRLFFSSMHLLRTEKYIDEYNFCNLTAKYTKFSQTSDKYEEKVAKIDPLKELFLK